MQGVSRKLFLISFILAIIASTAVYMYLKSLEKEEIKVDKTKILIATRDINPRVKIEKDMIKEIEVDSASIFGDYYIDKNEIIGKFSKEYIYENERFHKDRLINELEEEISLKIKDDFRAMSINVNPESGVSDLLKPGDYVDLIVYLPEIKEADDIIRPSISKIILQNIEILAIDKKIYRDEAERVEVPTNYVVLLSIPVLEVEKLALAEDVGDIKLALRPFGGKTYETDGAIWEELINNNVNETEDKAENEIEDKIENENKKYFYYTIKKGDTLRNISEKFYGDKMKYDVIMDENNIIDKNQIETGDVIKIPDLK